MPTQIQKDRVEKLIRKWRPRLSVDTWAITVVYEDTDQETADTKTLARILVNSMYSDARVTIYPEYFRQPHGQQVATIVHELAHIHTDKLEPLVRGKKVSTKTLHETWENITEQIARVAVKAYTRNSRKKSGYLL